MAIVTLRPDQPANIVTTPEVVIDQEKSNFNSLIPESSVLAVLKYPEGYPWTVDYYGQIVNENNTLNTFDPNMPNLLNPYYKVKQLILQVSSPLTSSYDATSGITTITGAAITPYKITPNPGDVFLAKVDTAEDAIFIINSVNRKTYRKDTLYEISYTLSFYKSANPLWIDNLESRVQDVYYFNPDTNYFNRDHLIAPETKEATDRLNSLLFLSKSLYFSKFFDTETSTLVVPGQEFKLYDHRLIKFITKTNDVLEHPNISKMYINNAYDNYYMNQDSILDLILKRDIIALPAIVKRHKFIDTSYFRNIPKLNNLLSIGIDYCLYPIDANKKTQYNNSPYYIDPTTDDASPYTVYNHTVDANNNFILANIPVDTLTGTKNTIHEVFLNNYYVVSENFYNYVNDQSAANANSISFIEFNIYKFLNKEAISKKDLYVCIKSFESWDDITQFYLLPVLWHISKNS
jgi:hypothetical protein